MSQYPYETEEWERLEAEVDAEVAAEGGSTGSNMAERPYLPPECREYFKNLPPEEKKKYYDLLPG